ncbi:hypothetical protein MMEU_2462 [Mycobacterium marinum str. Europe]|nr:hypothetical protein MMEU_2462 [Mycobacterium marinum str. Europe]
MDAARLGEADSAPPTSISAENISQPRNVAVGWSPGGLVAMSFAS